MKSFIVSTIIILGAYGFIYGLNKLFYRYSFFHSAPSIKTFSKGGLVWYFLSIKIGRASCRERGEISGGAA